MASFLNNLFGSPYKKYNIKLDEKFNNDPLAWSRPLRCFQQNIHYMDNPDVNFEVAVETIPRQGIREMETRLAVEQMVIDHSFKNPDIQQEFTRCFPDRRSHYQCIEVKGLSETSSCIGYAYMKNAKFTQRRPFEIPLSEVVTPPFNTFPLLSSHPDVSSRVLKDTDRFIIFGSGGFWKLISNEDAAKVVNTSPRDRIAERLATLAIEKGADKRGKNYRDLIEIPKSNCISGNNGNRNCGFRSAYHDDITVIVVYLDKRPNREGVRPEINSYIGCDNTVRQSEFRNFNNNANA
ncbi:hypothetical protein TSUD_336540 [Trifolium subterraneum]|uniref:PPM-type phosphatase domain-containing protein n=1 Tax=Trifolium subterraneum TaxID=3900 RepID=A0A2Z6MMB0_TRISU|nr:hypothetical protein TSUD_336540 [Trifolium subterraneum]